MPSMVNVHVRDEKTDKEIMDAWRKMSPADVSAKVNEYRKSSGLNRTKLDLEYKIGCRNYFETNDYSEGKTNTAGHKFCCEMLDYCKWYNQTWFMWTCIGVGVLILFCLIVICCCWFCSSGRGRGGKDWEEDEEENESKSTVKENDEEKE